MAGDERVNGNGAADRRLVPDRGSLRARLSLNYGSTRSARRTERLKTPDLWDRPTFNHRGKQDVKRSRRVQVSRSEVLV